ncbi:MAG: lipoprotein-releasing ABC transporter permease subunit [Gammaproteobacteria bacterium]|jgi:lipoprotein-releasing system permease protein
MLKPASLFIGLRYSRAKRRNHFISFIALASTLGIALGVTVLITVLSVMNGFERELQQRILGMAPHVVVTGLTGRLDDWPSLKETIDAQEGVSSSAPYITTQGMVRAGASNQFSLIQGIQPELHDQVSIIGDHMLAGELENLKAGEYGIILGSGIARKLGVFVGDKVTLISVEGTTATPAGISPRLKRFTLVGIFEVRAEIDARLAVVHIKDAEKLLRYPANEVSGLRIKADNVLRAASLSQQIYQTLDGPYFTSDWTRSHGSLFRAIKMEKTMMFILLTFIIAVAAFNIVTTLVMVVTDKQADIAILRTIGASPGQILSIFIVQGSLNGFFGTLLGLIGGISLSNSLPDIVVWVEQTFNVSLIPGDVYFVSFLPTQLLMSDVMNVSIAAFGMSILATLYPAWRASRVKPAEALRYE